MVRHSMKILALSAVLSKMLAQKVLCALCWGKSYSGALEDKGEKKFHNPCALFKETLKKKKNKKHKTFYSRKLEFALLSEPRHLPLSIGCAVTPGKRCGVLHRHVWGARCLLSWGGRREERALCPSPLCPSICGVRKEGWLPSVNADGCDGLARAARVSRALRLLLWCAWALWVTRAGVCLRGMSRRWARTSWVENLYLVISALIAACTVAFCTLVWGTAKSIGSLATRCVRLGRNSPESWSRGGFQRSWLMPEARQGEQWGPPLLVITLISNPRGEASGHARLHLRLNKWKK